MAHAFDFDLVVAHTHAAYTVQARSPRVGELPAQPLAPTDLTTALKGARARGVRKIG